jgi:osmoprotectant transport system permease protein
MKVNRVILRPLSLVALTGLFVWFIFERDIWISLASLIFPNESEFIYPRASLVVLVWEHLLLVFVSGIFAVSVGFLLGLFVTSPTGKEFLPAVNNITTLGQTFSPVAVLALAVPIVGFGFKPSIIALFLYSLLPVVRNTISGIEAVSRELVEVAYGLGLTRSQVLFRVELPLAMKVIMAGIRTSIVINIGTTTLAAVVGAGGLGSPIIAGLVRDNPAFVMEGAITAAFLAILVDRFLAWLEELFS